MPTRRQAAYRQERPRHRSSTSRIETVLDGTATLGQLSGGPSLLPSCMPGLNVFIASPVLGLEMIRDEIERWIRRNYGFDVTRSEMGGIGYRPGVHVEQSCYDTVRRCHFMILLIGCRYGQPAKEGPAWLKETYEGKDKVPASVTRWEFRVALHERIPIFAFVDPGVADKYRMRSSTEANLWNNEGRALIDFFGELDTLMGDRLAGLMPIITPRAIKSYLRKQWSEQFSSFARFHREMPLHDSLSSQIELLKTVTRQLTAVLDNRSVGQGLSPEDVELYGQKNRFISTQLASRLSAATGMSADELFMLFRLQPNVGSAVECLPLRQDPDHKSAWIGRDGVRVSDNDFWEALRMCKGVDGLPLDVRTRY